MNVKINWDLEYFNASSKFEVIMKFNTFHFC